MALEILSLQRTLPVDGDRLHQHAQWAMDALGCSKESLSLVLVNDRRMRGLNRDYRGKSSTTDVLSFEGPADIPILDSRFLGEIVISVPRAYRQALSEGIPPDDELSNLMIHGLCHLLGYDHERGEEDRRLMKEVEERAARYIRKREGSRKKTITGKIPEEPGPDLKIPRKNAMSKGRL